LILIVKIFLAILVHSIVFKLYTCTSLTGCTVFVFLCVQPPYWWACRGQNM